MNANIKTTAAQSRRLFEEGYRLAFRTKSKVKPWAKIFQLWHSAASCGHLRAQFYLGTCYDFGNGVRRMMTKHSIIWGYAMNLERVLHNPLAGLYTITLKQANLDTKKQQLN